MGLLVVGCPGGCGRPATKHAIICQDCMLDLPVELAAEIGRTYRQVEQACRDYTAYVMEAAHFFDQVRPLQPAPVAPKHRPNQWCDCPPPHAGKPYHCAARGPLPTLRDAEGGTQ
jgi:hypothetical protein